MTGLLSADTMSILLHILINIFITNVCLLIVNASFVKGFVKTKVRHDSGNNRIIRQLAVFLHISAAYIKNQVTIDDFAVLIHSDTSVCIAVKSKTYIQLFLFDKILQHMDMCGATIRINIETIRMVIDHIRLGTKRIEYTLSNHPGTAVRTVKTDTHAFIRTCCQRNQVSNITISSR